MKKDSTLSEEGKACTNCGEWKPWLDENGKWNFGKNGLDEEGNEKRLAQCRKCVNLASRKRWRATKSPPSLNDPSFPLEVNYRKARWVCKLHKDIPTNHYLNYRGHRVCRKCHFKSIVKANRERRRRQHPEWTPLSEGERVKRQTTRRGNKRAITRLEREVFKFLNDTKRNQDAKRLKK